MFYWKVSSKMIFYVLVGLAMASYKSNAHEYKVKSFHQEVAPVRTEDQKLFISKVKGTLYFNNQSYEINSNTTRLYWRAVGIAWKVLPRSLQLRLFLELKLIWTRFVWKPSWINRFWKELMNILQRNVQVETCWTQVDTSKYLYWFHGKHCIQFELLTLYFSFFLNRFENVE